MAITPLDPWIRGKAHIGPNASSADAAEQLGVYQLKRLNEAIEYARSRTIFYGRNLSPFGAPALTDISDLTKIPFTTPTDISSDPMAFLAVPQGEIERIVTLRTSGSTGGAKRIFFTANDMELTLDFFHHGMSTLVSPGQRVAVFLPGASPDTVGDLLTRALGRMNVRTLVYGAVEDSEDAARALLAFKADCVVGIPTQVLGIACSRTGAGIGPTSIKTALLCTDYVPESLSRRIAGKWGCEVFTHYGMTETGLGGGVECGSHSGYHLREAEYYFEIVDPETGRPCAEGQTGEVVVTSLLSCGMPLLRYRTGDISRMLPGPCACGTFLRRMERVSGRYEGRIKLGNGASLSIGGLDEVLFDLDGLLDYMAAAKTDHDGGLSLSIAVAAADGSGIAESDIENALLRLPTLEYAVRRGIIKKCSIKFSADGRLATSGAEKRKIAG